MSQDNYFHLPPNQNHAKRVESISWVGQNEVNFQLMKDHIQVLTKKSKSKIDVPIINRLFDRFDTTELKVEDYDMLIVEGTYAFEIAEKQSFKIFMTQTYRETKKNRHLRNRDSIDERIGLEVLEIEHQIIKKYNAKADLVIE